MVDTGTLTLIKEKIREIISLSDTSLQPEDDHVIGKWRLLTSQLHENKMPIVTVRIGPVNYLDAVYGRKLSPSQIGIYATVFFTAHVWHVRNKETEPEDQNTTEIADKIIKNLAQFSGDATSGVISFENVTSRPMEPSVGPTDFCRVAIEGYAFVKRVLT